MTPKPSPTIFPASLGYSIIRDGQVSNVRWEDAPPAIRRTILPLTNASGDVEPPLPTTEADSE